MSRLRPLGAMLAMLLSCHAAHAQQMVGDIKTCRQMPESARRLACYDALPLPAETGPAAAAAAATSATSAATDAAAKFGQEGLRPAAAAREVKRIESRIAGKFKGWGPNSQFELTNGQVWRIADGSNAIYELQDPKVIVHRGMLGAFYLEIEGVGFQMRVTRVR